MPDADTPAFVAATMAAETVFTAHSGAPVTLAPEQARQIVGDACGTKP